MPLSLTNGASTPHNSRTGHAEHSLRHTIGRDHRPAALLALAMVIPLSGCSVARFGTKQMWLKALSVFRIGSFAGSAVLLVPQGVGTLPWRAYTRITSC